MAVHRAKITHYFSPSDEHLRQFFASLTQLYADETHTDLRLVPQDGSPFVVHKILLAVRSPFLKDLFLNNVGTHGNDSEEVTIVLPNIKSITVNNLLSLLYTGKTLNQCDNEDLTELISLLKLDINCLEPLLTENASNFPLLSSSSSSSKSSNNTPIDSPTHTNGSESLLDDEDENHLDHHHHEEDDDDEEELLMEVTPHINSFVGNHFLADDEDLIDEGEDEYSNNNMFSSGNNGNGNNGISRVTDNERFSCRLCGKGSPNGASLFAHLLYPHYAHLWRTEIPHRTSKYECKSCPYATTKRQHFVMHVARVHDELRKKLSELGEDLGVLDNLTLKTSGAQDRIFSVIAKSSNGTSVSYDGIESPNSKGNNTENPSSTLSTMTPIPSKETLEEEDDKGSLFRFPRGSKPYVKCRLCGKAWKGKDNFFTHLVSTHFKYLWVNEVPRHADMFYCHVTGCNYQSKYRYNFLFHLAGKHKQLKQKLILEGVPLEVLSPLETDALDASLETGELKNTSGHFGSSAPGENGSGSSPRRTSLPIESNTRLICRVCSKVSLNHTCHRQHVVGKHFQKFWSHHSPDSSGMFYCEHVNCNYKTSNRSVFVIHLAYVHQELKNKIAESGRDPNCITPEVYGKRKYRRSSIKESPIAKKPNPIPSPILSNSIINSSKDEEKPIGYRCLLCKAEFSRHRGVIEHLALSHFQSDWDSGPASISSLGPYSCVHCSFSTASRTSYISHVSTLHEALKLILEAKELKISNLFESVFASSEEDEEGIEDEDFDALEDEDEDPMDDIEDYLEIKNDEEDIY